MFRITLFVSLIMVILMSYGCSDEPLIMEDTLAAPGANNDDGMCISYCATANLYVKVGDNPDDDFPLDYDQDGKIESCLKETLDGDGEHCHIQGPPICPENDTVCATRDNPLNAGTEEVPFWIYCKSIRGRDHH